MTAPYWSLPYLVSAVPILMILTRTTQPATGAAQRSRLCYKSSLLFILAWEAFDLVALYLPPDQQLASNILTRLVFFCVSMVVGLFALSSIYLQGSPEVYEYLVAASTPILAVCVNLLDPFTTVFGPYGWGGDINNPFLRYLWLAVLLVVLAWALMRLYMLRQRATDSAVRTRLNYFLVGYLFATVSGTFVYLLADFGLELSVVAVGFSLAIAAPAFA